MILIPEDLCPEGERDAVLMAVGRVLGRIELVQDEIREIRRTVNLNMREVSRGQAPEPPEP